MSYLDKLLDGVAVEWRPLENDKYGVARLSRGRVMSKEYLADNIGEYPVYSSQTANNGEIGKIRTFDIDGEAITWTTDGANAGTVFHRTGKFSITNVCGLIKIIDTNELNYKFLFYWLSIEAKKYVYSGMGNPKLMSNQVAKILIPIPPLSVQTEIVRILDKFSSLTAELQAELQARKSQYEYYRNQLLDYSMEESDQLSLCSSQSAASIQKDDNPSQPQSAPNPLTDNSVLPQRGKVEWKTLGEIGTLTIGRRFVRTDIQESGVPCFHYGDLYTYYGISAAKTKGYLSEVLAKKLRFAQPNDVIIVCAGENDMDIGVGVAWLGDEPAVVHDACCILHHNENPKYISHFLRTHNYHIQIKKYVKNGKISSLPISGLEKAVIPVPSLTEQARIVSILDKFDSLTNSISEGLPKLIELSQKRYEYYRDLLLSFPKDVIKA